MRHRKMAAPRRDEGICVSSSNPVASAAMRIRKASEADFDAMWAIFQAVVATGDTLPFASATGDEFFRAQWLAGHGGESFVALLGTTPCGMYKYGPNLPGLGSHVASATYLVGPESQGRGIGLAMVEHSLAQAEQAGFVAMQFNYVVATNK